MRTLALALITLSNAHAVGPASLPSCGEYILQGKLKLGVPTSTLLVHAKSDSEQAIRLSTPPGSGLAGLDGKWVQLRVKLASPGGEAELLALDGTLPLEKGQARRALELVRAEKCAESRPRR